MRFTDINETSKEFFKDIRKFNVLSKHKELELYHEYKNSSDKKHKQKIKDKIILSNLRWCISISKKYNITNIDQSDIISIAYCAMIENFDSFDISKNVRFATYMSFHISNAINKYIYGVSRTISDVTSNRLVDKHIKDTIRVLTSENNERIDDQLIVDRYNQTKEKKIQHITIKTLSDRLNIKKIDSLSRSITNSENDECELIDMIISDAPTTDSHLIDESEKNTMMSVLSKLLDKRELTIVSMRLGINCEEYSFDYIGKKLNLTSVRVNQIYNAAISKLQQNKNHFIL